MKFVVDVMLGRLARWLRLLGYDTLYSATYRDEELVRIAEAEGRILLTRDTGIARDWRVRSLLLVEGVEIGEQLRWVIGRLGIRADGPLFMRCVRCNGLLRSIVAAEAEGRVPPYVFRTHRAFHECEGCGHLYWPGSHIVRARRRLEALIGGMGQSDIDGGKGEV